MRRYICLIVVVVLWSLLAFKGDKIKWGPYESLPSWIKYAIKRRNEYNRMYADGWVWFNIGKFYIRNDYSYPQKDLFKCSDKHLLVWKR